jgi:hypothetical protein
MGSVEIGIDLRGKSGLREDHRGTGCRRDNTRPHKSFLAHFHSPDRETERRCSRGDGIVFCPFQPCGENVVPWT